MQKAINRFWDWLFHPGIRWYHYPKGKSSWFRYPSPGSIIKQHPVKDYKTPFQNTQLNIRYVKPIQSVSHTPDQIYAADGVGLKVVDKLRQVGLLQPGQNTQQQIQKAKQKFQQKYGVSADTRVYKNTVGQMIMPQGTNRQSYRQAIQASFKAMQQDRRVNDMPNSNRRFFKQPQAVWLQSLDMFSHPHFQQTRIDVNYKLDNYANQNAKRGYINIRKGEKSFWKALDDSNDTKNIQKVQKFIGDDNPTDFTLRDTKIQLIKDQNGKVIDVQPKTRSV